MIIYGNGLVGYILTLISLISASFAVIISFIVILTVIHHQYHNRLKKEEKITLILSTNIYIFFLIFMIVLIEVNIETLIGDVYGNDFDSSLCVFKGYFMASICCTIYHAFVTQVNDFFVLVQQIEPKFAAKITGMFLELDIKYILMLIQSQQVLKDKIKEALNVLQVHQYRQRNVIKP
ncbi:unnamed protein product [Adineta steineri]|uniref:PABC domain-containing protein n=1 Tax=Adineta steineri TaxID=433720 RepID=A0A813RIU5_9BILA|nr:unnamed protein product [Adineta steineri]